MSDKNHMSEAKSISMHQSHTEIKVPDDHALALQYTEIQTLLHLLKSLKKDLRERDLLIADLQKQKELYLAIHQESEDINKQKDNTIKILETSYSLRIGRKMGEIVPLAICNFVKINIGQGSERSSAKTPGSGITLKKAYDLIKQGAWGYLFRDPPGAPFQEPDIIKVSLEKEGLERKPDITVFCDHINRVGDKVRGVLIIDHDLGGGSNSYSQDLANTLLQNSAVLWLKYQAGLGVFRLLYFHKDKK